MFDFSTYVYVFFMFDWHFRFYLDVINHSFVTCG